MDKFDIFSNIFDEVIWSSNAVLLHIIVLTYV